MIYGIDIVNLLMKSKELQLDLAKGKISFDDEMVQYFIPAIYALTDVDFIRVIAENTLIEEDCKVVMNFLDQFEALAKVNQQMLNEAVVDGFKNMMK